ncbi:MAG: hypothetical protein DMG06_21975 [Acidobacteria bacterium]|nr:MAG: hypothetical protein DMG06_21975 [Acidobacteriota bacterium]
MSLEVNFRRCIFLICFLGIALAGGAVVLADKGEKGNDDNDKGAPIRWDIIHATFGAVLIVDAGGQASVMAEDHSKITFTGHGTFQTNSDKHHPQAVTGGGTWETFDHDNVSTGSGTYKVTRFVSWENAPGSPIPGTIDNIGDGTLADNRGGLAVLSIFYSDGSQGILVVSCHLPGAGPPTTPHSVFEGVTATKGFVDYWEPVAPVPAVDGNRTLFHLLQKSAKDDD